MTEIYTKTAQPIEVAPVSRRYDHLSKRFTKAETEEPLSVLPSRTDGEIQSTPSTDKTNRFDYSRLAIAKKHKQELARRARIKQVISILHQLKDTATV